ncbi:NAD(P)/FAD-dependent oxidoreductase [Spirosoma foliorum]|uniref:FAD-dependent monooxygenase n=1 Tax=Spirosoma foliorum TaxID=2710596 RepID=A0A7G5GSX8_9BACT|nr:FAD-dependent oxidoreductase [Spirosoma foliorum]QMW01970.1 FAD-dependent monooxygenase [Spirosoma foliorum]
MPYDADVLIIGGGLAGLTAGIHLAQANVRVILIEKHAYPQHKVCGEYVSNEVLPYLQQLGVSVNEFNPSQLSRFLFSTASGKTIESNLPLGGFGLSRYTFDNLLYKKALESGVTGIQAQVVDVQFTNDSFVVTTSDDKSYTAQLVIGAYGKRSSLDKRLHRAFIEKESPWMGVKAHYRAEFPSDLVSLHNFQGGYCGLCQVENGIVNACYLVNYSSFKKYKSIDSFQHEVMNQNPFLKDFFSKATPLFNKPLTISQISFSKKQPIENHLLMCGDTAGVIHPLCGNGMAMAIHSAKICSELVITYLHTPEMTRATLEKYYIHAWNKEFTTRLTAGRLLQSVLQNATAASVLLNGLQLTPAILPLIIKQTHGSLLAVN